MQLGQDLVNILTPSMQRRKKESIQKHVADLQANIHTWRVFFLADAELRGHLLTLAAATRKVFTLCLA